MDMTLADPKGLIRESYAIENISPAECRSIYLDWALSLGARVSVVEAAHALLARFAREHPEHPMSQLLDEGLSTPPAAVRKGGRGGRLRQTP